MATQTAGVDEPWYTDPATTWVPACAASGRPFRYGDLFVAPPADADGQPLISTGKTPTPWDAVLVISPSCDVVSKAGADDAIHVTRVKDLTTQSQPQRAAVTAGWKLVDGQARVAFASFAYLPGVADSAAHKHDMYADFRQVRRVRYEDLAAAGRIAAMEHDARVALIRRELHYKYRWILSMDDVRGLEAARISGDGNYLGPRPAWAAGAT